MTPRVILVLNRRLDRVFLEMECAWVVCKRNQADAASKSRYLAALRRADRLWGMIKQFTKS